MNHTPLYISRDDHAKLRVLLATALYSDANSARRKLRDELDRATVLDPAAMPDDVVTMGSTVTFEDLATGESKRTPSLIRTAPISKPTASRSWLRSAPR